VARDLARAGRGSIVNMSSVNGTLAIPSIASYNVSKGGINQLTRVMALSLADKGIRVNAVAPGTIATALAAKAVLTSEEAKARIMSRTPLRRLGEPAEIADHVLVPVQQQLLVGLTHIKNGYDRSGRHQSPVARLKPRSFASSARTFRDL
jgi:NAD(P)-dependent dehydrogenase (short-subunit alcohol dehydrogenase family)